MSATEKQIREAIPIARCATAPVESILLAREKLLVTLARGCPADGPYWSTPKGGTFKVQRMEKLGCYRFTLDLIPPNPWPELSDVSHGKDTP